MISCACSLAFDLNICILHKFLWNEVTVNFFNDVIFLIFNFLFNLIQVNVSIVLSVYRLLNVVTKRLFTILITITISLFVLTSLEI